MINQLKLEMNNLTRLVEAGAGLSIGEEATMNELLKQKEELTAERDSQVSPLQALATPHMIRALPMSLEIVNTSCAPRHSHATWPFGIIHDPGHKQQSCSNVSPNTYAEPLLLSLYCYQQAIHRVLQAER